MLSCKSVKLPRAKNFSEQITFQCRVPYNANYSALHLVSGPVGGWGANDITTFVSLAQTDGDVGGGRGELLLS